MNRNKCPAKKDFKKREGIKEKIVIKTGLRPLFKLQKL